MKSYGIAQRSHYGREKFSMKHVKNGISSAPVRFENRGAALAMKDVLNIAIARFGDWSDLIEKRGDELVLTDEMKDFENDCADFEYVDVMTIDDSIDDFIDFTIDT
jgi:hypothetical protein